MIGFAFDYASTASLLAFKPTCALADELGVDVHWLPYPVATRESPASQARETVAERHTRVRAEYFARDAARYAKVQGIELNRDAAGVDTALACGGCLWADRHGLARPFTRQVLLEFWAGRLDIEDRHAIDAVLTEVGAPGFEGFDFREALATHKAGLEQRGVFNVPTYLVADQLFTGRAHLPMIRWLLGGRHGPGPL